MYTTRGGRQCATVRCCLILFKGMAPSLSHLALLTQVGVAGACTAVGVGRDASATGYPMIGHSEDSGPVPNDVRLVRVPRKKHAPGSMRPLYNWQATYPRVVNADLSPDYAPFQDEVESTALGAIPQIPETYAYWDTDYGVQNEMGLSIGESTCTAKTVGWPSDKPYGYNKAGIEDLSKLALERCSTARCAVETMGQIAVEQGFYSADSGEPSNPAYSGSSECLIVGDGAPGEVWVFNVMTGRNNASAIWAAQRAPSNAIVYVANAFTIRKMNLSDHENFAYSPGVTTLAEDMGWWSPKQESTPDTFDFFGAYGYVPEDEHMRDILNYYSGRRMWRIAALLSPDEGLKLDAKIGHLPTTEAPYPFSVPAPKGSVTRQMVMQLYRDHYEGTPYDLTQGMAAGPNGNPNRGRVDPTIKGQWERAIAMFRSSWSFVLDAKPNGRSITWYGHDAPHGTAYLPFYGASTESAPLAWRKPGGSMAKFDTEMSWWAFNFVSQYQDLNFREINRDVSAMQLRIETEAQKKIAEWEAEVAEEPADKAVAMLTEKANAFVEEKVAEWWTFAWGLVVKFRGYVVTLNHTAAGENVSGQPYPDWWINSPEVGYIQWSNDGPYHGVTLTEADLHPKASCSGALDLAADLTAGGSWNAAVVAVMTAVPMVGLAYFAGLQQGRRSVKPDAYFAVGV
eukprot:TRINITY_DN7014_c0_g1_i2.p1 TRINITY_DN7014_c0_g1~~TRINITY_DN7014_c0_g1_i2.p1  ORF type:complete len:681 (+),score=156.56 TRINITY_DN7014_c0_g1_i2:67-2109(+)